MTVDVFSCVADGNPDDLRGCIDSYVQHARLHGRNLRVIVVDQVSSATDRNASREVAVLSHRSNKVDIEYVSVREIEIFLVRAARYSWVDIDVLRYAILGDHQIGSSYGAACNVARFVAGNVNSLITGAGTKCEIVAAPGGRDQPVSRQSHGKSLSDPLFADVEPLTFFDSMEAAKVLPQTPEEDLWSHLGKALADHQAVSLGTWGDVGVESPGFYLLSSQAPALAVNDDVYAANRLNRIVHRSVRFPISGAVNLRPIAFGVSPAAQVPFLPTETASGGLFGQSIFGLLLRINGQSITSIPLAIKHAPAQAFAYEDVSEVSQRISLTDFLSVMVDSVGSCPGPTGLGARLAGMAADSSFVAATAGSWGRYISESAQTRRGQVAGSAAMQADLDILIEAGLRVLDSPHRRGQAGQQVIESLLPYECRSGRCATHRAPALFRQIAQFSKLLAAWPSLVAAVSDLDKNGVRLGTYI